MDTRKRYVTLFRTCTPCFPSILGTLSRQYNLRVSKQEFNVGNSYNQNCGTRTMEESSKFRIMATPSIHLSGDLKIPSLMTCNGPYLCLTFIYYTKEKSYRISLLWFLSSSVSFSRDRNHFPLVFVVITLYFLELPNVSGHLCQILHSVFAGEVQQGNILFHLDITYL